MTEKEFIEICKIAVSNDGSALDCVPEPPHPKITEKEYIDICKIAISQDDESWEHVPNKLWDQVRAEFAKENANHKELARLKQLIEGLK